MVYKYLKESIKDILYIISLSSIDNNLKNKLSNYYNNLLINCDDIIDLNILNDYFENINYNKNIILDYDIIKRDSLWRIYTI